jgi:hypothetical protein
MKLIAHRGNIEGPNPQRENDPEYILEAIDRGYDVEIDVWGRKQFWLGHDSAQYPCTLSFLMQNKNKLWIHCKNDLALFTLIHFESLNIFFHQEDDYTLTSKGYIWTYPKKSVCEKSVLVLEDTRNYVGKNCFGLCGDYLV